MSPMVTTLMHQYIRQVPDALNSSIYRPLSSQAAQLFFNHLRVECCSGLAGTERELFLLPEILVAVARLVIKLLQALVARLLEQLL